MNAKLDEYAEIVRSMLDHESDVINHRVTWMATFQGLLFAALGFSWNRVGARELVHIFCLLGIATSILSFFSLLKASLATRNIFDWWSENCASHYHGPPIIGHAFGPRSRFRFLLAPWNIIPFCFIGVWSWIAHINMSV